MIANWFMIAVFALGQGADGPKGHLVVLGGGALGEELRRSILELAGGPNARVVVVPQASNDPEGGKIVANRFREIGAKEVTILDLQDPKEAVKAIESADLIWFRGGSQNRLMDELTKGGVRDAIRERFRRGATIAGTSAGAAVMSASMIAGYAGPRGTPQGRAPRLSEGLGLWPDVIVDQHFLKRNRIGRLKAAVHEHPNLVGIGIDESTGVVVTGREFEVLGQSDVVVIDGRKAADARAKSKSTEKSGPMADDKNSPMADDSTPTADDFEIHTLKPGMKYSLDKGILGEKIAAKP